MAERDPGSPRRRPSPGPGVALARTVSAHPGPTWTTGDPPGTRPDPVPGNPEETDAMLDDHVTWRRNIKENANLGLTDSESAKGLASAGWQAATRVDNDVSASALYTGLL